VPEDERDTSIVAEVTPLGPMKSGGRVFTKLQRRISPYSKKMSPNHMQQDQFNRSYYRIEQSGFAPINVDQENKSMSVNIIK
jgi:cell division FtsZ-interacting protein ZapD